MARQIWTFDLDDGQDDLKKRSVDCYVLDMVANRTFSFRLSELWFCWFAEPSSIVCTIGELVLTFAFSYWIVACNMKHAHNTINAFDPYGEISLNIVLDGWNSSMENESRKWIEWAKHAL